MTGVRYKIPMLSAKAILAYAKPVGEDIYSFNLNKAETASVLLNHGDTYQDDNAVFYQLMSMLHRDGYSPKGDELIIDTDNMTVTINGENAIMYLADSSTFFTLSAADIIRYEGTGTADIRLLWKDRWY